MRRQPCILARGQFPGGGRPGLPLPPDMPALWKVTRYPTAWAASATASVMGSWIPVVGTARWRGSAYLPSEGPDSGPGRLVTRLASHPGSCLSSVRSNAARIYRPRRRRRPPGLPRGSSQSCCELTFRLADAGGMRPCQPRLIARRDGRRPRRGPARLPAQLAGLSH
jgi:hypothetical protein